MAPSPPFCILSAKTGNERPTDSNFSANKITTKLLLKNNSEFSAPPTFFVETYLLAYPMPSTEPCASRA